MSEILASWEDSALGRCVLKQVTGPAAEPVSVAEVKSHTKIDIDADDALLDTYIKAARRYIGKRCGRTVHQETLELILGQFPAGSEIILPRATPLLTVASIKYKDSTGLIETTWTASEYIAETDDLPGRVVLGYGYSWPSGADYPSNPIRIRYNAGIATASPITEAGEDIKIPMFLMVAHQYQNREVLTDRTNPAMLPLGIRAWLEQLTVEYVF